MRISKDKKVEPIKPIAKTEQVKRRIETYMGDIDPAVIIHSNKTHRTVSEAFRDADYATPFWRSKSDFEEAVDFVEQALLGLLWVGIVAGLVGAVVYWLFFS